MNTKLVIVSPETAHMKPILLCEGCELVFTPDLLMDIVSNYNPYIVCPDCGVHASILAIYKEYESRMEVNQSPGCCDCASRGICNLIEYGE